MKPNLFIVGAPKAGTTTLCAILESHPNIYFSKPKELNYFSNTELKYENSYYKDIIIRSKKDYLSYFNKSTNYTYMAEGSVSYFGYPLVPYKIAEFNNKSKIIILLRNPITRAFSHYLMDKRMGLINVELDKILDDPTNYMGHYYQYIIISKYYQHIKNYIDIFGRSSVKICILENQSYESIVEEIWNFLNLPYNKVSIDNYNLNKYKEAKFRFVTFFQKNRWITSRLKKYLNISLLKKLNNLFYRETDKPSMSSELYNKLYNILNVDLHRLENLISKDLSKWK